MSVGGRKLITANEPTIIAKLLLYAIVVENGQSNRGLADSANTN